jgi:hypothetical protein
MGHINIEVMLLSWAETSNGGAKIVLQLADADDLERFKLMTLAKGKRAGQRLAAVFVEIGDDERPVPHRKSGAGPLAQLAGRWCEDERFQGWLFERFHEAVTETAPENCDSFDGAALAAMVLRHVCGVSSRAELDTNPNAGRSFHKLIREPYHAWLEEKSNG